MQRSLLCEATSEGGGYMIRVKLTWIRLCHTFNYRLKVNPYTPIFTYFSYVCNTAFVASDGSSEVIATCEAKVGLCLVR